MSRTAYQLLYDISDPIGAKAMTDAANSKVRTLRKELDAATRYHRVKEEHKVCVYSLDDSYQKYICFGNCISLYVQIRI